MLHDDAYRLVLVKPTATSETQRKSNIIPISKSFILLWIGLNQIFISQVRFGIQITFITRPN